MPSQRYDWRPIPRGMNRRQRWQLRVSVHMVSEVSGLEWDDLDTTHFYVEPIVGGYEVVHDLTGWMGEFPDLPTAKQFAEVTHALSDV